MEDISPRETSPIPTKATIVIGILGPKAIRIWKEEMKKLKLSFAK